MMPTPEVPSLPAASCDDGDLGVGGLLGLGTRPDRRDLGGTADAACQGSDHRLGSQSGMGRGADRADPESATATQATKCLAREAMRAELVEVRPSTSSGRMSSGYCSEEVSRIRLSKAFSRRGRLSHRAIPSCGSWSPSIPASPATRRGDSPDRARRLWPGWLRTLPAACPAAGEGACRTRPAEEQDA